MKYLPILSNGIARINVGLSSFDNKHMIELPFLLDTGATRTCINKFILIKKLGYTEDWINKNKIVFPKEKWPVMANGESLEVYGIPAIKLLIDGHEIYRNNKDEYFLTSDVAPKLSFLLGTDVLSYFDMIFKYSEKKVYYEFRQDRIKLQEKPGDSFAYKAE